MYYDEFYEPSEFELMIDEWKYELRESVKKEYKDEMNRLREENAKLTEIKNNWNEKIRELENEKAELRKARCDLENKIRKERLHELLAPLKVQAWGFKYEYEYIKDKCNKCDEKGYIHYKTPRGRDAEEMCACRETIAVYRPIEADIIRLSEPRRKISLYFEYERNGYGDEDRYCRTSSIYNGQDFDTINKWSGMIFLNKEDCQKYCDYLNEKEKNKDKGN